MQKLLLELYQYMECTGICTRCQNIRVTVDSKNDYRNNGYNGPSAFCPYCKANTPLRSQACVGLTGPHRRIFDFAAMIGKVDPDKYVKLLWQQDGIDVGTFKNEVWSNLSMPAVRLQYRVHGIPRRSIADYMSDSLVVLSFDLGKALISTQSSLPVRSFIQYLKDYRQARMRLEEIGFKIDCTNPPSYGKTDPRQAILDEGIKKLEAAGVIKGFGGHAESTSEEFCACGRRGSRCICVKPAAPEISLPPHEARDKIRTNLNKLFEERAAKEKEDRERQENQDSLKAKMLEALEKKKGEKTEKLETVEEPKPADTESSDEVREDIKNKLLEGIRRRGGVAHGDNEEKPKLTEAELENWRIATQQPKKDVEFRRFISKLDAVTGTYTEMYYNDKNKLIRTIIRKRNEPEADTRYEYNNNGDVLMEIVNFGTKEQNTTRYEYDDKKLVARIYDYGTPNQRVCLEGVSEEANLGCTQDLASDIKKQLGERIMQGLKKSESTNEFEISSFEIVEEHTEESDEIGELGVLKK